MANEFKARALYDFQGQDENELSFNTNDILTITATASPGNGWWYAKNSYGKSGAVPENYLQTIVDETPEPSEPPPSYTYPDLSVLNGGGYGSQNNYAPPHNIHNDPFAWSQTPQYTNTNINEAPLAWQSSTNTSHPSSNSPTENVVLTSEPMSAFSDENQTYIQVSDLSISQELNKTLDTLPLNGTNFEETNDWYSSAEDVLLDHGVPQAYQNTDYSNQNRNTEYTGQESHLVTNMVEQRHDLWSPVSMHEQQLQQSTTSNVDLFSQEAMYPGNISLQSSALPSNSNQYNTLSGLNITEPTLFQSQQPFVTFPSQPTKTKPSESNLDDDYTPRGSSSNLSETLSATSLPPTQNTEKKSKEHKQKFFTLKRSKSISSKTQLKLEESFDAATTPKPKKDTDSDDSFSDTENQPRPHTSLNSLPNTHLQPNRPSSGDLTAKPAPRARFVLSTFFDRHGLDSYLLNGFKAKTDERVDIAFNEHEGTVYWANNPSTPPFTVKIEDPIRSTKLAGFKTFMEYKIQAQRPGGKLVGRRYKQFDWLHDQLVLKYRFICIPPLPGKQIAGRFEQDFVQERKRLLELWLNRICRHPVLCASFPVQHFLTCELSEKTVKEWKVGKRKIEKDEMKEAQWLACVSLVSTGHTDQQIMQQIDLFAQQQPLLETHLRNLNQGLTKYSERHIEVYERDIQKVGELFTKLHGALQVDAETIGNKDLSSSIQTIGKSYDNIAEFYKSQANGGLRDFLEHIQEYLGIVQCFPAILSIQR
ncbi:unnamed protein product, partial [Didymodactylos carnosus]